MAKQITEEHSLAFDSSYPSRGIKVVASNNLTHMLQIIRWSSNNYWIELTTEEMRKIASFLNEIAAKIDADPDFNPKKS